MTYAMRFNLGVIMKYFTKVLILLQVEVGRFTLSELLVSFDLGFKQPNADKISIDHLLNSSAAFADTFVAE